MAAEAHLRFALTWLFLALVSPVLGSPVLFTLHELSERSTPDVNVSSNGTVTITNSSGSAISQGSASDGSGTAFSASAIIWIVYCLAIGVPLAFAGIKLPRLTTGSAIGFTATACLWAAFINTEDSDSLSDLVITLIPVCLFVPGCLFGLYRFGHLPGMLLLVVASGLSWGMRIALFRDDLLVRPVYGDWIIGAGFALINVIFVPFFERLAVAFASASCGTFLIGLAIDLIVNKQSGMSFGLRYLCDRNSAHWLDIVYPGWKPPTSTIIILAVSLGLSPVLATLQHFLYPDSWRPVTEDDGEQHSPARPSAEALNHEKADGLPAIVCDSAPPTPSKESFADTNIESLRQSRISELNA